MNMETAHRKKDSVRLQEQRQGGDGIATLSLNVVAYEAGVSKGGLLHHFPNKQALFFALFACLLAIMEEAISALMAADKTAYGRFIRAYLHNLYLSAPELTDTQESRQLMVLSLAMPDEPVLRKCWRDWMLAQGDELYNGYTDTLVRYAADGIWLSELTEGRTMSNEHSKALVKTRHNMTLPT